MRLDPVTLCMLHTNVVFFCILDRGEVIMKRTNIVLDEKLVSRGKRMTGLKTTRGLVDHALRELVRRKNQRRILALRGEVDWRGDLSRMRSVRGVS